MHILIVGGRGVGKSTLIKRLLSELKCSVWGFETKKEENGDIYIYEAGKPHVQSEENLVGNCVNQKPTVFPLAFERFARKLCEPDGDVIVMDELGFMESQSETFCNAVLRLFDGKTPIIAAVKEKNTAFLETVRTHKNARVFHISAENRDALFDEVRDFVLSEAMFEVAALK